MCANSHHIYVFSFDEMDKLISGAKRFNTSTTKLDAWERLKTMWRRQNGKTLVAASYGAAAKDVHTLGLLLTDLGWFGARAYIRVYRGIPHIIIKGRIAERKIFTAARYSLENKKVLKMALGKMGAIEDVKEGGIWTFVILTAYRVADCAMGDATILQTAGRIGTDAVKVGIVTGASILASSAVGAFGTALAGSSVGIAAAAGGFLVAIGPLAAVVLVGFIGAYALDKLDEHYHITERVVAGLHELKTKGIAEIKAEKKKLMYATKRLANDVDSVIDYATDKIGPTLIHSWHNLSEWAKPVAFLKEVI